jgi:hypothetical protein
MNILDRKTESSLTVPRANSECLTNRKRTPNVIFLQYSRRAHSALAA